MDIKYEWDLTSFYQGFENPDFQRDMLQIDDQYIKDFGKNSYEKRESGVWFKGNVPGNLWMENKI